ncbi:MAG TPA: hypothetical protein VFE51_30610 [Verrucomicrobiae bacterium]|nr:hypothetical protein [Verrucomicrobiae bacterium]
MKYILFLTLVASLLTTGCILPGHRGGGDYDHREQYRGYDGDRPHEEDRGRSEYHSYSEPTVDVRIRR